MIGNIVRLLTVLALSGAVAWAVTELRINDLESETNIPDNSEPVAVTERETVVLGTVVIQPILNGNAAVVPGDSTGSWVLEAPVEPIDQAYRLLTNPVGVRAQITGGPSGFECPWLGLGPGGETGVTMRCQIPADIPVVEGLRGLMVLQMEPPAELIGLPLTAVIGIAQQGQVIVVHDDGTSEIRSVQLGKSDTFSIEIVSGLEPDERVLRTPVQSDFAQVAS